MPIIRRNDEKNVTRQIKASTKTHATFKEKKNIPVYAEGIHHFLVNRAGWLVTEIYQYFTFSQPNYKKDFMIMNQRSRHKATTDVKSYFYKLLSNLNFGIDFKSNIDSRTLEPLYDELGETAFIKKCDDMFDRRNYYQFADPDIMREEINKKFDRLTLILSKNDP